jgi:dephospho-CoA kinase
MAVKKKILILGHMRHGKDTAAQMLQEEFGYTFESSSEAAARIFLYDALKEKYGYKTPEECFEDRMNRRAEWFDLICEYNKEDAARLAKEILKKSDVYVGMRSKEEIQECQRQGVFDLVIGIFNPDKPLEDPSSNNINIWRVSDVVLPNAGTLDDLRQKIKKLKYLL